MLTNISGSNENQAMKFSQLIEYNNMRNIFLEKSYTKCGGETIPRPFLENQNWAYLWINSLKLFIACFYCVSSCGLLQHNETKLLTTSYKAFLKNKKRAATSLPTSFSAWFLKKYIPLVMLYYLTNSHCLVVLTSWGIGQNEYCHCLLTGFWCHKFLN